MSRCIQCNIEVLDEAQHCPLCQSALEHTIEVENMYPDIRMRTRKLVMISRIYLFLVIVAEIILVNVSFFFDWSSIVYLINGMAFFYGYMVIRYAILGKSGYIAKTVVLTALALAMLVAADFVVGYNGWSVNYVLPSGILLIDAGVILMMVINRKNWQSYMMLEIFMVLCGGVMLLLYLFGIVTSPLMSAVAFNVSVILFLGTVIIGGRRARVELKRRFHI